MSRRLFALVTCIVAMVVTMGVSSASAAQLSVVAATEVFATPVRPCADLYGSLAVSPEGVGQGQQRSQVTISSLPAECQGSAFPIEVYVHNKGGNEKWTGTLSNGATSATPTVGVAGGPTYNANSVETVIVKIGGWLFPVAWGGSTPEPTGPYCIGVNSAGMPTGDACTLTSASGAGWPAGSNGANTQGNFHYGGSTKAPYMVLVMNVSDYIGFTPRVVTPTVTGVTLAPGYACTSLPTLRLMQQVQYPGNTNGTAFWGGFDAYARANAATTSSVCS